MISYIFILDDISKIDDLFKAVNMVKDHAVWIGVSTVAGAEEDILKYLQENVRQYNLIANAENYSDYYKVDQFIPHFRSGWSYVHKIGELYRESWREDVDHFVKDGWKFAFISDECENINDTCFYNAIFKMLHGNRPVSGEWKNFYDKVDTEDSNMLLRWEDVQNAIQD